MDPTRADLFDLGTFAVVARLRSFSRAAKQLGISASGVSHSIRGLEERLGVRLLNRTTRSVQPTEAGERLLARLEPAFRDIADGLDDVGQTRGLPSGTIRLNVPRMAASLLLAPVVPRYLDCYPDMSVEIVVEDRLVDIVAGGFDAGIRFDDSLPQDMIAVPLAPSIRMAVVATPEYFTRHPIPDCPDDLRGHSCIRWRYPGGGMYKWEFERDGQPLTVEVDGNLATTDGNIMLAATLSGHGIAYLPEQDAEPHLKAGTLIRALDEWCPAFRLYLYYPSRRQVHPGLRALIDLLRP